MIFRNISKPRSISKTSSEVPVKCEKCDKTFESEDDLEVHFIATHVDANVSKKLIKRTQNMITATNLNNQNNLVLLFRAE